MNCFIGDKILFAQGCNLLLKPFWIKVPETKILSLSCDLWTCTINHGCNTAHMMRRGDFRHCTFSPSRPVHPVCRVIIVVAVVVTLYNGRDAGFAAVCAMYSLWHDGRPILTIAKWVFGSNDEGINWSMSGKTVAFLLLDCLFWSYQFSHQCWACRQQHHYYSLTSWLRLAC